MRKLEFIGTVRTGRCRFAHEMVIPGRDSLFLKPDDWPRQLALGTRRVKVAGDHWVVAEKKGRKVFSKGVWASAATIERIRADLEAERSTEGHVKRKEADARRRDKAQAEYVEDFLGAVRSFLRGREEGPKGLLKGRM